MNKVLVIDDSLANLFLIQSAFDSDCEVSLFIESESVLAQGTIRRIMPDLILLDLMMPNMDGFQLLEAIKADNETLSIPIIIVSAHLDNQTIRRAMDAGAVDFIPKPLDLSLIRQKVYEFFQLVKV